MRPNEQYYSALNGRWSSRFSMAITDWSAYRAARLSLLDRLGFAVMTLLGRLPGLVRMETDLRCPSGASEVGHTLRIRVAGLTVMRTEETFALDPNGVDVVVRLRRWTWPGLGAGLDEGEGRATIDPDAAGATYDLPMMGTRMRQRATVRGDVVEIVQETPWLRGEQRLERLPAR